MYEAIAKSWQAVLTEEFKQDYFLELTKAVDLAYERGLVFPNKENIFKAFELCPFNEVKVVILGQDPYHSPGQAHGLAFSVPDKVTIPPSLKNIYKELAADLDIIKYPNGNLKNWAKQGVLLLNNVLTVENDKPDSHKNIGWEKFTNAVIKKISTKNSPVVFILWGKAAAEKVLLIDGKKHLVLTAAHPSPLSAYRGFFGCKHFSLTNQFLIRHNLSPIYW